MKKKQLLVIKKVNSNFGARAGSLGVSPGVVSFLPEPRFLWRVA
jgi:hypothetical protein